MASGASHPDGASARLGSFSRQYIVSPNTCARQSVSSLFSSTSAAKNNKKYQCSTKQREFINNQHDRHRPRQSRCLYHMTADKYSLAFEGAVCIHRLPERSEIRPRLRPHSKSSLERIFWSRRAIVRLQASDVQMSDLAFSHKHSCRRRLRLMSFAFTAFLLLQLSLCLVSPISTQQIHDHFRFGAPQLASDSGEAHTELSLIHRQASKIHRKALRHYHNHVPGDHKLSSATRNFRLAESMQNEPKETQNEMNVNHGDGSFVMHNHAWHSGQNDERSLQLDSHGDQNNELLTRGQRLANNRNYHELAKRNEHHASRNHNHGGPGVRFASRPNHHHHHHHHRPDPNDEEGGHAWDMVDGEPVEQINKRHFNYNQADGFGFVAKPEVPTSYQNEDSDVVRTGQRQVPEQPPIVVRSSDNSYVSAGPLETTSVLPPMIPNEIRTNKITTSHNEVDFDDDDDDDDDQNNKRDDDKDDGIKDNKIGGKSHQDHFKSESRRNKPSQLPRNSLQHHFHHNNRHPHNQISSNQGVTSTLNKYFLASFSDISTTATTTQRINYDDLEADVQSEAVEPESDINTMKYRPTVDSSASDYIRLDSHSINSRPKEQSLLSIEDNYLVNPNTIIRARNSIDKGATYINYTIVTSLNACLVECWILDTCDTAIYQELPVDLANINRLPYFYQTQEHLSLSSFYDAPLKKSSSSNNDIEKDSFESLVVERGSQSGSGFYLCHLFECNKPDGHKCSYAPHSHYVSSTARVLKTKLPLKGFQGSQAISLSSPYIIDVDTDGGTTTEFSSNFTTPVTNMSVSLNTTSWLNSDSIDLEFVESGELATSNKRYGHNIADSRGEKSNTLINNRHSFIEIDRKTNGDGKGKIFSGRRSADDGVVLGDMAIVTSETSQPHYSKVIATHHTVGQRPLWHETPHLASIRIGQEEDFDEYNRGGINSAIIAIMFGIGVTSMLIVVVGHKMKSIRQRMAYKGRRRSLVPDTDYLINTIPI